MADDMIYTHANTQTWITNAPMAMKADIEPSDFAGVTWVLASGLYSLGELGGEQAINEFELIDSEWVQKSKGSRNGGTMTNVYIPKPLDPGQIKLNEAINEKCRPYGIKIVRGADCSPESTVAISVATPGVVTWNAHGLTAGQAVVFSTTGALPTGLTAGTVYYVASAGLTANSFSVSATPGGTGITTSAAGSGTHTAVAPPMGMTDMFQALVTDGARSGGSKNDAYTRTYNLAVTGRIITV